jgi:methylmalonyl-CoA/ethylmalonyl-CoA epimerase
MSPVPPPSSSSSLLGPIGQIAVNAKDVARATAYYRDVLGLAFLFSAGPTLSFFDASGVRLMISAPENPEFDHPSSVIYFRVAALEAAVGELERRGARFESRPHPVARMPDHELWMAFLRDSEGNLVGLMEERR